MGWINNKVLLCSTGNYIQYPVINHQGKEYEKNYNHSHTYTCVYIYVYMMGYDVKYNFFYSEYESKQVGGIPPPWLTQDIY